MEAYIGRVLVFISVLVATPFMWGFVGAWDRFDDAKHQYSKEVADYQRRGIPLDGGFVAVANANGNIRIRGGTCPLVKPSFFNDGYLPAVDDAFDLMDRWRHPIYAVEFAFFLSAASRRRGFTD